MSPALALIRATSDHAPRVAHHRGARSTADEAMAPVPAESTDSAPDNGPLPRAEERHLVSAAQRGDRDAFGALVRAHQRRAYGVARAIVATHEDAEDAVQEGFLHAYRALDRFLTGQPFGAWLHRIVANAALDLTRRRRVREADALPDSLAVPLFDPAEASDLRARLHVGLAALSDRQRAVIVLHDVQGFRHGEIGRLLGIPEGTARSDLFHARLALRRALRSLREVP
jgi:RNA polymerase sigma-70 factor (ECF subfamily)